MLQGLSVGGPLCSKATVFQGLSFIWHRCSKGSMFLILNVPRAHQCSRASVVSSPVTEGSKASVFQGFSVPGNRKYRKYRKYKKYRKYRKHIETQNIEVIFYLACLGSMIRHVCYLLSLSTSLCLVDDGLLRKVNTAFLNKIYDLV